MAAVCVQAIWTASAASISSFGAAASIIASAARAPLFYFFASRQGASHAKSP